MADQIVSWGGFNSKGTSGLGITGSLSLSSGSIAVTGPNSMSFNYTADDTSPTFIKMTNGGNGVNTGGTIAFPYGSIIGNYGGITLGTSGGSSYNLKLATSGDLTWTGANLNFQTSGNSSIGSSGISGTSMTFKSGGSFVFNSFLGGARDIIKFSQAGNLQVGGFTDAARVEIKGSGTTSSTTALLVQNANASASLAVLDNGNIGIGTASPTAQLHFNGQGSGTYLIKAPGINGNPQFQIYRPQDNTTSVIWYSTGNTPQGSINNDTSARMRISGSWFIDNDGVSLLEAYSGYTKPALDLYTYTYQYDFNTPLLRARTNTGNTVGDTIFQVNQNGNIYTSGSIGIGTTSPAAKLHISGSSGSALFEIDSPAVNNILFVSGSGNVGIGTGIPSASLHISGSSGSVLFEIDSPSQQNILYVSGSGRIGIGKSTEYALEIANTSSLLVSATGWAPTTNSTASAAVSINPNIFATAGGRSYYSLYVANPGITISGSFGTYDFRSIYAAGKIDAPGGINAGNSRFYATSNAVSFQGYNPFNGTTGADHGGITFTSRQVDGNDEAGIGATYGNGSRLYLYNKYNASDSKIIFALGGTTPTIRGAFFGTGNLSIGNGETDMSARLGVKGSGTTSSTTSFLVQNANASSSLYVTDDSRTYVNYTTPYDSDTENGGLVVRNPIGYTAALGVTSDSYLRIKANKIVYSVPSTSTQLIQTANLFEPFNDVQGLIVKSAYPGLQYNVDTTDLTVGSSQTRSSGGTFKAINVVPVISSSVAGQTIGIYISGSDTIGRTKAIVADAGDVFVNSGSISIRTQNSSSALNIYKSGSTVLDIQGSSGQLFSVTDSLTGSLFSVNTVAGLPVIEAFSNNVVNIGKYGNYNLIVSGSNTTITGSLVLNGSNVSSAWTAYTPDWTTDGGTQPVLNNGTLTGAYKVIGKTCFVRVKLNPGSTTTFGSGAFQFSLPFSASSPDGIQFPCSILNNGFAWYQATVNGTYSGATNKSALIAQSAGGVNSSEAVTATHPITFGTSDSIQFNGSYEIA